MVNMRMTIELNGIDKKMEKILKELTDFDTPLRKSGVYMEGSMGKRFRNGGGSRPWRRLSAATIRRHPRRAGGKPLNDTGRLRASVTSGASKRITGKRLYYGMGSGLVYGAIHNFGGRHIPQREFMYFDGEDEKAIKKIFEQAVKELIQ